MRLPRSWPAGRVSASATRRCRWTAHAMSHEPKLPMRSDLLVTIVPTRSETRILVTVGRDEVMKGRLTPPSVTFPNAAPRLLGAIVLWHQRRVHTVVSADGDVGWALGLLDGVRRGAPYSVEWIDACAPHGRGGRARGLGDFRDVRRYVRLVQSR